MNRKFIINSIILMGMAIILASSCQEKKSIIKGQLPENPVNEVTVYLRDYKDLSTALDSMVVKNGVDYEFKFVVPNDGQELWVIDIPSVGNEKGTKISFIPEKGTISVDAKEKVAVGTPLNDELANYKREIREIANGEEDQDKAIEQMVAKATVFMDKHIDHPVAILPFKIIANYSPDVQIKMDAVKKLNGRFDDYKEVKNASEMIENLSATRVGEQFKDFEGTIYTSSKDQGKPCKISDILGKGQYVIVDFFASWCPPCRAEIKDTLKPLYKEYRNKGLAILGVSVSDKLEDNLKAIEDLGIEWPVLYDGNNTGANLYGVSSIPMIMLVGPDGKIIARNIYGDEVRNAVKEVFK